ncbi:hypothetical protein AKJ09_11426 [Labilithrix luteola]|uniref:Uncharacterized protein n=1 Tax=Labilithrix luteola TaxID=1391654 RepID=A0A0K1QGC1_9BACT|nr:hypothetical protein [Labilithrix luteola]AKV04763.1 hypothetical protein AKJ09_11426 [Labilithrix luteola]
MKRQRPMLLEWVAPPECPSERDVVTHVTAIAGELAASQPLHVVASVSRTRGLGWRLELRVGNQVDAPRVFESDDCKKLADTTALIVALDLQSRASERSETKERNEETQAGRPPPPAREVPKPPPEEREARVYVVPASGHSSRAVRERLHAGIGADVAVDAGTLPSLAWGVGAFGFLGYRALHAELSATLWPHVAASADIPMGGGANVVLRTVALRGCWTALPRLDACARLEAGRVHTTGFGIRKPATGEGWWLAPLLGITLRPVDWSGLRPRVTAELGVPALTTDVVIEGVGRVYTPWPVFVRLSLGVETSLF